MRTWTFKITKTEDGAPIEGATVSLGIGISGGVGIVRTAETNIDGQCRIEVDVPDEWALAITVFAHARGE